MYVIVVKEGGDVGPLGYLLNLFAWQLYWYHYLTHRQVKKTKPDEVVLLENTRFYKGESKNEPDHAKKVRETEGSLAREREQYHQ